MTSSLGHYRLFAGSMFSKMPMQSLQSRHNINTQTSKSFFTISVLTFSHFVWRFHHLPRSFIIHAKARECFHRRWYVCVCLSVTTITKKGGQISTKFYAKVHAGKGKTKFVFRYDR